MPLLPLLLLLGWASPASAQSPKMKAVGETADCSITPDGNASQDCGQFLEQIFKALKPTAVTLKPQLSKMVFRYFPNFQGVSVNCNQNGSAFESFSPAAAEDCGGKTAPFIVAGTNVWSMAGRCVSENGSYNTHLGDAAAFVMAHELAHLVLGHPGASRDDIAGFCKNQWFPNWIKDPSSDAVAFLTPIIEKNKSRGDAAMKGAVAVASLKHCVDAWNGWGSDGGKVPPAISGAWQQLKRRAKEREDAADSFGSMEILRAYNADAAKHAQDASNPIPYVSPNAGTCAMLDLKAFEDALTGGLQVKAPAGYVSDHPESDVRAERLALIQEQMCGSASAPNSICDPPLSLAPKP